MPSITWPESKTSKASSEISMATSGFIVSPSGIVSNFRGKSRSVPQVESDEEEEKNIESQESEFGYDHTQKIVDRLRNAREKGQIPEAYRIDVISVSYVVQTPTFHGTPNVRNYLLQYVVPSRWKTIPKKILNNISFTVHPGSMTLILGPRGSGKTTLLRILANEINKEGKITGAVLFDGQEPNKKDFHRRVSLVTQEDIHLEALTVIQTLRFAARLQAKEGVSLKEIEDRVQLVMEILGLTHRKNTLIGGDIIKGLSGGEKRRMTIGIELVKDPQFLLLDEPTTGLDATTALKIFQSLRIIADQQCPVIASLQQPGKQLISLFDNILLLSGGELAYFGPVSSCLAYFQELGYVCPEGENMGDFLLEVLEKDQFQEQNEEGEKAEKLGDKFKDYLKSNAFQQRVKSQSVASSRLKPVNDQQSQQTDEKRLDFDEVTQDDDEFLTDNQERELLVEQVDIHKSILTLPHNQNLPPYSASYPVQLFFLFRRGLQTWYNNPEPILARVISAIIVAIIIGTVVLVPGNDPAQVASKAGVLFFIALFSAQSGMAQLPTILSERKTFYMQTRKGYYSRVNYFLCYACLDIPIAAIEAVAFSVITYWLCGLNPLPDRFFYFCAMVILIYFAMTAFTRAVGYLAPNLDIANLTVPLLVVGMTLLTPFSVSPQNIPPYIKWISWASVFNYMFQGLYINNFQGLDLECSESQEPCFDSGDEVIRAAGIYFPFWVKYVFLGVIIVYFVIFQIIGFLGVFFTFQNPRQRDTVEASKKRNLLKEGVRAEQLATSLSPVFVWHNISYTVKIPKRGPIWKFWKGKDDFTIISEVSGFVSPGMMLALMGPSGAGKTTLLDVLANRKTAGKITGEILINGMPREKTKFNRFTGYVEQMNIHVQTATVEEAFEFSAFTRLSSSVSHSDIFAHIEWILTALDLRNLRKSLIMELSFEQQKRVTFGVELAANPSLLFLDEPTSGLDSQAASAMMQKVKMISESGRAVVCTIHQPNKAIFLQFTHVLLMRKGGKVVYFGPIGENASSLLNYFESMGISCPSDENPADFILNHAGSPEDVTNEAEQKDLAKSYLDSDIYASNQKELEQSSVESEAPQYKSAFASSFWMQFMQLSYRAVMRWNRNPLSFLFIVVQSIFFGLFLGFMFFQLPYNQASIADRSRVLFYSLLFSTTAGQLAIPVMFEERAVFYREKAAGCYHTLVYMLSVVVGMMPMMLFAVVLMGFPVYFLSNLLYDAWAVGEFFGIIVAITFIEQGIAMACIGSITSAEAAITLLYAINIVNTLMCGDLILYANIRPWWKWGFWVSFLKWGLEEVVVDQLHGLPFDCSVDDDDCYTGNEYLDFIDYRYYGGWPIGLFVLIGMYFVCLGITFLTLWKINHLQR